MKTHESRARGLWLGGAGALGLALLAGACGGSVHKTGGAAGSTGSSGASGTASAGTSTGGGSVPNEDCRPVGRYQVGKEGGYLPCCPGLSELSTLLEATDEAGRRSCQQLPLRSYSCTEGSCGDGVCAEGEAPCGCGVDCPDSNWRASEASCETYRDQSPPPDVRVISISNTGTAPLYLLSEPTDCGPPTSLVSVTRDGERVDVSPPPACRTSCQSVMDAGWPYRPGQATPVCSSATCPSPAPVQILPGETLQQATYLEVVPQQLPRSCAAGIASETIDCYARVIPQPGNYTLTVRAALTNCAPTDDCNCDPDPSGACRNRNLPLRAPLLIDTPSSWYFQNQQIELSVRVD